MQRVLGLDIGSYSIKAVEIVNRFKSYEVVNFYENVVPPFDDIPLDVTVPTCMEQLFSENHIVADRIITAMPGQFVSSRIIDFSFTDPRKIQASIPVELEELVPFNLDDMIIDNQILGSIGGRNLVLAVMTRKVFLKNFLELLSRIQIDPKLVDVDSLSFYNLSHLLVRDRPGSIAIIDIGHEKTSVCIVKDGLLRMFRSINLGGRYITDFIARDMDVTFQQAQRLKHRVSFVLPAGTGQPESGLGQEDFEIAERTTMASHAIMKELGRTLYAFKNQDQAPIDQIYISGGTSKIANMEIVLAEQLETPVERLTLELSEIAHDDHIKENEAELIQALAIGVRAVTGIKKTSQINLRRGDFSYVHNYEEAVGIATKASQVFAFLMILLAVSYGFKYTFYSAQIDELQSAFRKEYGAIVKEGRSSRSAKMTFGRFRQDAKKKLAQGIESSESAIAAYKVYQSGSDALELLQEMSTKIAPDTKVDVTVFDYKGTGPGRGQITLKAETDNFETQAVIIDQLRTIQGLDTEEKGSGAKPGSNGEIIEFTLQGRYETQAKG